MLVDDDALVRDGLGREIAGWSAKTLVAASADEALSLIARPGRLPPDCVIADRDLDGPTSGPMLLDIMRQRLGLASPAVIVRGATDPDAIEELRRPGHPWTIEPVDPLALKRIVVELCARQAGPASR